MAELVDAPDSKSGHLGGVGSIPSTPTKIKRNESFSIFIQLDIRTVIKKVRILVFGIHFFY